MSLYLIKNIECKLKKSILKTEDFKLRKKQDIVFFTNFNKKDQKIYLNKILILFSSIFFDNLVYNFLYNSSSLIFNKKLKRKIFISFLSFYKYFNLFFNKNSKISYKKYFFKKNNLFYLNSKKRFPLAKRLICFRTSVENLKKNKINFFKKYGLIKNKNFRKKNLLIFQKKFLKAFSKLRREPYVVYSLMNCLKLDISAFPYLNRKKIKISYFFDVLAKKIYIKKLRSRIYYSFHKKKCFISVPKKYYKKRKKYYFNKNKNLFLCFSRPKFLFIFPRIKFKNKFQKRYIKIRKKKWKLIYDKKVLFKESNVFFYNFNFYWGQYLLQNKRKKWLKKSKNYLYIFKKKKLKRKRLKRFKDLVLDDYFDTFFNKIVRWRLNKKRFKKTFYNQSIFSPIRVKNLMYYIRYKKKKVFFNTINFFKFFKNFKYLSSSLFFYKIFLYKIKWRKRKYFKKYSIFFLKNFVLNKIPIAFIDNYNLNQLHFCKKKRKINYFFDLLLKKKKSKKIFGYIWLKKKKSIFIKKKKKWIKQKLWIKKKRFKLWAKRRFLRLLIIFFFLRFFEKWVNSKKFLVFRNANLLRNIKFLNYRLISYSFSTFWPFYFKSFIIRDTFLNNKLNTNFIFLLKK